MQTEFAFVDTFNMVQDVRDFQAKFGIPKHSVPVFDKPVLDFRVRFLKEELDETIAAAEAGDLVEVADGLTDILYVAIGAMVSLGLPIEALWKEVHSTNMKKEVAPPGSPCWKHCVKPEGWEKPRIEWQLVLAGFDKEASK